MSDIDNSEVSYFLLDHRVQCRSNDLPRGTGMKLFLIPLTSSFLFAFSFLRLSIYPVNSSCSRHEIGNTITYETMRFNKQNKYKPIGGS